MSNNSAGRVRALSDVYACSFETVMTGFLFKRDGGTLWAPLASCRHPFRGIDLPKSKDLASRTFDFVEKNPFDIVHLSKPLFPNILAGILYKIIWSARVLMDVDDEDLGTVKDPQRVLPLSEFLGRYSGRRRLKQFVGHEGTRVGVGLWDLFDGVTVSNSALQNRYGGLIIPHARSAENFRPSEKQKAAAREEFGIPNNVTVFLFFGTVRKHKGVVETARALSKLGREDVLYVIAGSIEYDAIADELTAMEGLNLKVLPSQSYERISNIVGLADACVLLQEKDSLLAQYQLPAKLVDALAMGLLVFITPTPAVRNICEAGAAIPVEIEDLEKTLASYLEAKEEYEHIRRNGRTFFLEHLSVEACSGALASFATQNLRQQRATYELAPKNVTTVFRYIGGWSTFVRR